MREDVLREAEALARDIEETAIAMRIDIADMKGLMDKIEANVERCDAEVARMLATVDRMDRHLARIEQRLDEDGSAHRSH